MPLVNPTRTLVVARRDALAHLPWLLVLLLSPHAVHAECPAWCNPYTAAMDLCASCSEPSPPPSPPAPPLHPADWPASPPPPPRGRVDLIFDTDMSIDVDDVGALCVAHALADLGEARLLAVVHGTGQPEGAAAIRAINEYYGRGGLAIGAYNGDVGKPKKTPGPPWTNHGKGWYVHELVEEFRPSGGASGTSLQVMLDKLRGAADHSVTIASVGHATNLVDLLDAPGGRDPVVEKVKELVWMGGGNGGGVRKQESNPRAALPLLCPSRDRARVFEPRSRRNGISRRVVVPSAERTTRWLG